MAKDLRHLRSTKSVISQEIIPTKECGILGNIPNADDCGYFCLYVEGQEKTLNNDGICKAECAFKIFRRKEG